MGNDPLHWYPWYWKDWRLNRKVRRMNLTERGLYRELLDECWAEGSIPSDFDDLAEIANCSRAEIEAAWPALAPSFSERADGRLVNDKIARVLLAQMEALARQQAGGRRGGQKRVANLKAALSQPQATKQSRETATATAGAAALEAAPPPPATNGARPAVSAAVQKATDPSTAIEQQYRDVAAASKRIPPPPHTAAPDPLADVPDAQPMTEAEKAEWRAALAP